MPYFATERARRDGASADKRGQPLVLTQPAGASVVVAQVCPHARQLGLRPGLSLGQAQAIAPNLEALPYEPQRDRAALAKLARWALRFSPLVEPAEPDTLLLDITGCELLFGGEENLARQAMDGLMGRDDRARARVPWATKGCACVDTHGQATLAHGTPLSQAVSPHADGTPLSPVVSALTDQSLTELGFASDVIAKRMFLGTLRPARAPAATFATDRYDTLGRRTVTREPAGFYVRAAVADTVGAAYALAAAGRDALTIVPAGQTIAYLTPLPPASLRIDPQVADRLDMLGIRTIGDLLALPRAALPARFGPELVIRLQQALGEVSEGVASHRPQEVPCARLRFENPVAEPQVISAAVQQLLAEVFAQLQQRERALRRLELVLYYEHAQPQVVSIGLSRASRTLQHVFSLLTQRLEHVDVTPGVTALLLVARQTSRWHATQDELFEPRTPQDAEALGGLIDRLVTQLGAAAVLRPQLIDDHQPERAFRYVPVGDVAAGASPAVRGRSSRRAVPLYRLPAQGELQSGANICLRNAPPSPDPLPDREGCITRALDREGGAIPPSAPDADQSEISPAPSEAAPARPVRLLARPILIRVMALVPDGPPAWFSYRGQEYVVAHACGPERLETAWWRGPDIRRDYFHVTTSSGEQFWLFRVAGDGQWYLHGLFA